MSQPVSLLENQSRLESFGTTREIEFFKYLPPVTTPLHHVDRNPLPANFTAHPSLDPTLSAFAQLGALRLDAKRVIISLFGRHEQYILTEATRTLSLRDETDHDARDELWVGACTMSYDRSLCASMANTPSSVSRSPAKIPVSVIPDLSLDEMYHSHPDVSNYPSIRFLASAPIFSPRGVVIGAYTILDDKPRTLPGPGILKFLSEMAATVMDYLVTTRSRAQHIRGERMMAGLGSFLEGKGSLRTSWLEQNGQILSPGLVDDVEGQLNTRQQDKQRVEASTNALGGKKGQSSMPFRLNSHVPSKASKKHGPSDLPSQSTRHRSNSPKSARIRTHTERKTLTEQVQATFSRAANVVRESIEVEGVAYFDANFSGQDALVASNKSDCESNPGSSASEEEGMDSGKTAPPEIVDARAQNSGSATVQPAKILGFATSTAASVNEELTGDAQISISEAFLAGLLRRYPRGKIFNFGEDGAISTGDTSDGIFTNPYPRPGKRYKKTRSSILRQDALTLRNLAPESRSVLFSPIWNSHKSRWYAGTIAWTKSPERIFTLEDELNFCTALGASLIAEVHRLGASFAEQAKRDLLASLSHELRSPLHGIFGTADLLSDTALDALQRGFVHTVASCANTLLGSINQLLEFSSINDMERTHGLGSTPAAEPSAQSSLQIDHAVECIVETVFSGFAFFDKSRVPLRGALGASAARSQSAGLPGAVTVILDLDNASNWNFATSPGAWHLIITNLLGNALKYTQQGHILLSAQAKPVDPQPSEELERSQVTISVQDTGCGMSPEFVRNGYFTAFSQEDNLSPGNGLGASIVQKTITSLGGEIKVSSVKEVGTQVTVSFVLDHATGQGLSGRVSTESSEDDPFASTRRLMDNKRIGILGLGSSEVDAALSLSLRKICEDWLQMEVYKIAPSDAHFRHCDFYIAPHQYLDMGNLEIKSIVPDSSIANLTSPVIVICPTPRIAHSLSKAAGLRGDTDVLEFITQPCGPRKIAKSLEVCYKRQERRNQSPHPGGSTTPELSKCSSSTSLVGHWASKSDIDLLGRSAPPPNVQGYFSGRPSPQIQGPTSAPTAGDALVIDSSSRQDSPLVLLVDDNPINMTLLIAFMKKLKLDYLTAQNGQEALDIFTEHSSRVCLVLMDISMPIMDGLESTRQIRRFEGSLKPHARVVIVALTGVAQADTQREAMASGMDLFLTKPVRLQTILQVLQDHTKLKLPVKNEKKTAPLQGALFKRQQP
ncbi:Signal transduction histidine kinase-related protein [Penicillium ucsense]|uniref:histidine kinase n=1 Tax=Penicillium ucsense TaxID=2839758 RepID=A0A8J8W1I8_9EURO|nr:Signal transduction histidine kinase-related protein [Penicillium ucsense]KAF7733734.1 Signal transduction histidine kinase-related protein [Penicillium ucsense]